MNQFFCTILLVAATQCCHSQEVLQPVPKAKFITSFPFKQYSGGVMVVNALLNDFKDTLNFILDTGSGGISIDSTTCAHLGLKGRQSDTTITGMGVARKVKFLYDQQLHFPGLTVDKLNFHINNYEVLSSVYGERIDGIIGYNFLSRYIVNINFDTSQIDVYSPGEYAYPRGGTVLRPAFTNLPIQNLHIRDKRSIDFSFYLDTGAGLCFLMSEMFAKDSSVVLSRRKPVYTQAEGMGGKLEMQLTVVKLVQVGKYRFRNVPTYIFKDDFNVTSYPYVGGLLGNDLLRRFNMTLNYPRREIHLLPNKHFSELFDYAYTGLAMYFIDGLIMVDQVAKGSPAEKAGIREDDVLVAVGNSFSNNIMQYKTMLQQTGEKISIIVRRNGELVQLYIKPRSIL